MVNNYLIRIGPPYIDVNLEEKKKAINNALIAAFDISYRHASLLEIVRLLVTQPPHPTASSYGNSKLMEILQFLLDNRIGRINCLLAFAIKQHKQLSGFYQLSKGN